MYINIWNQQWNGAHGHYSRVFLLVAVWVFSSGFCWKARFQGGYMDGRRQYMRNKCGDGSFGESGVSIAMQTKKMLHTRAKVIPIR
jgi:hypothetical protein